MSEETVNILIVDDHPVVRMGLSMAIETFDHCVVVGEAASGEEALFLCQKLRPDVVLLDLQMDGIGGIQAAKSIRESYDGIFVIALTSFADHATASATVKAGVHGFLLKDFSASELEQTITDVRAGKTVFSDEITKQLDAGAATIPSSDFNLGEQQMKVLFFVTKGLTNKEISGQMGISIATVRYHIGIILDKLGVSNRTEASAMAIANNLID
jgi:DNA-binding NarL/FixJ family response regulator